MHHLELLIKFLQYLAPDFLNIDNKIHDALIDARDKFKALTKSSLDGDIPPKPKSSDFFIYWQIFTGSLFLLFTLSCVSALAQFYQMNIDNDVSAILRARIPLGLRAEYTCTTTGRLNLPPPTLISPISKTALQKGSLID